MISSYASKMTEQGFNDRKTIEGMTAVDLRAVEISVEEDLKLCLRSLARNRLDQSLFDKIEGMVKVEKREEEEEYEVREEDVILVMSVCERKGGESEIIRRMLKDLKGNVNTVINQLLLPSSNHEEIEKVDLDGYIMKPPSKRPKHDHCKEEEEEEIEEEEEMKEGRGDLMRSFSKTKELHLVTQLGRCNEMAGKIMLEASGGDVRIALGLLLGRDVGEEEMGRLMLKEDESKEEEEEEEKEIEEGIRDGSDFYVIFFFFLLDMLGSYDMMCVIRVGRSFDGDNESIFHFLCYGS